MSKVTWRAYTVVGFVDDGARRSSVAPPRPFRPQVVEDWNVTPGDGHLYFTFRPPWVAARVTDTFYALHPEQRIFQDPRLKRAANAQAAATRSTGSASDMGGLLAAMKSGSAGGASGAVVQPDLS